MGFGATGSTWGTRHGQEHRYGCRVDEDGNVVTFGDLRVQFSGSYEYNVADDDVAPAWAVNYAVKFLFPL